MPPKPQSKYTKTFTHTNFIFIIFALIQLNMNTLHYNLIEVDKTLPITIKTKSGLILEVPKEGSGYELCPQEGILDTPTVGSKYKQGDVLIFEHQVSDRETDYFGKQHYLALDEEVIGWKEVEWEYDEVGSKKQTVSILSHNRIVCEEIEYNAAPKSDILIIPENKETQSQKFVITYSPFENFNVGDEIIVKKNHDYPIKRLKKVFVKPEDVIQNETTKEIYNGFTIIEVEKHDNVIQNEAGLYLSKKHAKKGIGKVFSGTEENYIGCNVYFKKGFPFENKDKAFRAVLSNDILAIV